MAKRLEQVRRIEELPHPRILKSHVPADMPGSPVVNRQVLAPTNRRNTSQPSRYPGLARGEDHILQKHGKACEMPARSCCELFRHSWHQVVYVARNPKDNFPHIACGGVEDGHACRTR